ncbi:MAG: hypothetical protein IJ498_04930 [Akkermansia sp.]|nr:hypothetical protein [Akkermansia sp.]
MTRMCLLLLAAAVLLPGCRTRLDMGISAVNPPERMPEVQAWSKGEKLTMGADTGSQLPAVVFPVTATKLGSKIRWGKPVQPGSLSVSLTRNGSPVQENCPVVHSFFATTDGLIGWPELRKHVWHLDYDKGKHEFRATLPPEVRQWDSVAVRKWGRPMVHIKGLGDCLLDSGAPHAVYLPPDKWKRFLKSYPQARILQFSGDSPAAGGYFRIAVVPVPKLQLGRLQLENVMVCESFFKSPHVVLGTQILEQVEVWLDGPGRRLYFRPSAPVTSDQKVLSLSV